MENIITLTEVKNLARQLPLQDKVRLIEWIAPQIERDLRKVQPTSRKSLRGLWRDLDLTEANINEARREMWSNFPREDI
jgi:hypothetical protein